MGAVDYFLKIDGIEGESEDAWHKHEIEVESWSWAEAQTSQASGGAGGAGKVSIEGFHLTMRVSKASPKLMLACADGQYLGSAVLTARQAGSGQPEFLKWTLSNVLVSSYQTGGAAAGFPVDRVSLTFAKIQVEYQPQQPDGSLGQPLRAGWDLQTNRPA